MNGTRGLTPKLGGHLSQFLAYEATAFLAFSGNLLVCILLLRKRTLLRKSYNVYFLSLAILDILIAVTMAITYAIVLSDVASFSFGNNRLGEFVCRILWSRWLLYCLFALSIYICLLLNIERWRAVVRPLIYQGTASKKKVFTSLILSTFLALILTFTFPFEVDHNSFPGQSLECAWKPISGISQGIWGIFQFTGLLLIPSLVMIGLFSHSVHKTKVNVVPIHNHSNHCHSTMTQTVNTTHYTVTKMIATASFFMILCWAPNQVYFLLSKFGILKLDTAIHHYLETLAFFNVCINPAIYGVTSQTIRKGYWEVMLGLCPVSVRARLAQSRGGLEESVGSVIFLVHTLHRRRSHDWRFSGIRRSAAVENENSCPTTISEAIPTNETNSA